MELNNAVPMLRKFDAFAGLMQAKDSGKNEHAQEQSGFRKVSFYGPQGHARHIEHMARRIEKISNMLDRLQQTQPALADAKTVVVERAQDDAASFNYKKTTDQYGVVTEEYSFKLQYKPTSDAGFKEIELQPVETKGIAASTEPVVKIAGPSGIPSTVEKSPISTVSTAKEILPTGLEQLETIASELKSFSERVAALIEYYRIDKDTAPAPAAAVATETVAAPVEVATVPASEPVDNTQYIDAQYVARLYSGPGDDSLDINAESARRIGMGAGDDILSIIAEQAARVRTGRGDDTLNINADEIARIRTGAGDDVVTLEANEVRRVKTGAGDDKLTIDAETVTRINTGKGDDMLAINADTITRVNTGEGDDTLELTANTIKRVNAGAGDDTITLDADDAAIAFGKGGGEDVINITSVGALAIQIDSALASSADDVTIISENGSVVLEFVSGERLTINNIDNADVVSARIGGETVELHMAAAPMELEMSA